MCGRGRVEQRAVTVRALLPGDYHWPGARQVFCAMPVLSVSLRWPQVGAQEAERTARRTGVLRLRFAGLLRGEHVQHVAESWHWPERHVAGRHRALPARIGWSGGRHERSRCLDSVRRERAS